MELVLSSVKHRKACAPGSLLPLPGYILHREGNIMDFCPWASSLWYLPSKLTPLSEAHQILWEKALRRQDLTCRAFKKVYGEGLVQVTEGL